jgi:catechol 2,3-dioxygenase-like lactoylglutathione lyase family enzyme
MGLQDCTVGAAIPVSDIGKAKEFYESKLGLTGGSDENDGGTTYECGDATRLHIYPSPEAGKSAATLAGFRTDDVPGLVDELSSNGVAFEQYDMDPIKTDEKGIANLAGTQVAWFKDPDGNTFGIIGT